MRGWKFKHDHVSYEGWEAMIVLFSVQSWNPNEKLVDYCVLQDWKQENWKERKCAENTHNNVVWFCKFQTLYIIICLCNFLMPCSIVSFCTFWTLQLWKVTLRIFEIRRKKKMAMIQIKRWNEKVLCYEWKGVIREEITWRQTKLLLGRNYLKILDKERAKHIDIKGEKDI